MKQTNIENLKSKAICEIIKNNHSNKKFLNELVEQTSYKTALASIILIRENMSKRTICISKKGLNQANKYIKTWKKEKNVLGCTEVIYNISKTIKINELKKIIKVMSKFMNTKIYIRQKGSVKNLIKNINMCLKIEEICDEFEKEKYIRQKLLKNDTQIKIIGEKKRKEIFAKKNKRTRRAIDSLSSKKLSSVEKYKTELQKICKNYNVELNSRDFFIDYDKLKNICNIKKHY